MSSVIAASHYIDSGNPGYGVGDGEFRLLGSCGMVIENYTFKPRPPVLFRRRIANIP